MGNISNVNPIYYRQCGDVLYALRGGVCNCIFSVVLPCSLPSCGG